MAINKLHDEFHALDMNTGWELPAGSNVWALPSERQTPTDPAVQRRRKLKDLASTWMSQDAFHGKIGGETPVFGP